MRRTWDAAAISDLDHVYVGDPGTGRQELDGFLGRLGGDPRRGTCVEVGCGPGRMTGELAERFERVIAVDVSPQMLERARAAVGVGGARVEFRVVSGERLDTVESGVADVVVCYLVLQHLPTRRIVTRYIEEFARVLGSGGEAYVQLPVLAGGLRARLWRLARNLAIPLTSAVRPEVTEQASYRGYRITERELRAALERAGLRVAARDEAGESPYRHAREVFLRLERGA
jgi:ubiquinone/menaquinone biosynthesis C-methylase UbiE